MSGQNRAPSSNTFYFFAVMFWIIAWWLIDMGVNEPVTRGVGVAFALFGLGHAMGGVNQAIPTPSPFANWIGKIAWAVRPRSWLIAWAGIFLIIWIFGKPMVLWNYGGGRCQYIDWNFQSHVRPAQGDGASAGCRFLATK